MKLETMEKCLVLYPNRFQLTMMAVARAREINDGDAPVVELKDAGKPVAVALEEISQGEIIPGSVEEMNRIRSARKVLREKALMEARERDAMLALEEAAEEETGQVEVSGEI